jgi:hypothetical protein
MHVSPHRASLRTILELVHHTIIMQKAFRSQFHVSGEPLHDRHHGYEPQRWYTARAFSSEYEVWAREHLGDLPFPKVLPRFNVRKVDHRIQE